MPFLEINPKVSGTYRTLHLQQKSNGNIPNKQTATKHSWNKQLEMFLPVPAVTASIEPSLTQEMNYLFENQNAVIYPTLGKSANKNIKNTK